MSTPSPWEGLHPIASLTSAPGAVTLVEGQTFALSGRTGDMLPPHPHGLFVLDRRVLSTWVMQLNGHPVEPLAVAPLEPFAARFAGRGRPAVGQADADLVCFRERHVSQGMREHIRITNYAQREADIEVSLRVDADFADVFAVKENRVGPRARTLDDHELEVLRFEDRGGTDRIVEVSAPGALTVAGGLIVWRDRLEPGATWERCIEVSVTVGGKELEDRFTCDGSDPLARLAEQRLAAWRASLPRVLTDDGRLAEAVRRSGEDLGALRIFDPDHPQVPILAAGAPWFMTVFGRDSLITAWMALIAEPALAQGVLETLARFQGEKVDDGTEEQPGRILHEMRFGGIEEMALGSGSIYYGSVDATPLFVMLLAELWRWWPNREVCESLLPYADRALSWITDYADLDGDGFVEYHRRSPSGLVNQGWKDSWDGVRFEDGRLAESPIALCEVQGYVYAAYRGRAELARAWGDEQRATAWDARADDLRERFDRAFWLPDRGCYAMALDAAKQPVDAVASNMGHCLWTGIVREDRAEQVAAHLLSHELFTGFGLRTLSSAMTAYNPVSYHNGSVWPHDNAIAAAGLARYGFVDFAHRLIDAQLEVASMSDGRLPELFAGFDRHALDVPAAYPASCSPQAWAAASPLLWLRTLLRLEPDASAGVVRLDPALLPSMRRLRVAGVQVGGHALEIDVLGDHVEVNGHGGLHIERSG